MSIARKHKQRVIDKRETLAKQEQVAEGDVKLVGLLSSANTSIGPVPAELQLLEKQLASDVETLKILKGDQQREPHKQTLIEKYRPLCEWYMENFNDWGHIQSLAWWFVWRADSEAFIDIEPLLYKAVTHGLSAPMAFKADWQSWYCDLVKNYYNDMLKADKKPEPMIINKVITDIVNGDIVLNQPLKAKLFALYGKVALLSDDHKTAAKAFEKALGFDEAVGVKKLLKVSLEIVEKQQADQGEIDAE